MAKYYNNSSTEKFLTMKPNQTSFTALLDTHKAKVKSSLLIRLAAYWDPVTIRLCDRFRALKTVTRNLPTLTLSFFGSISGPALVVKADIEIRSMGPISEKDMVYSLDCYFRQVWTDARLAFNASIERVTNVSLNVKMLDRIWHPDTIFLNGGSSYVHTITTPNKFFRLSHDGTVLYSQRLTIKASCPMHLEKFPMDTQKCPLHIASFGYPVEDVIYEWHYGNDLAAVASSDMRLSQFDLKGMPACNITKLFKG
ncbi:gamma-aminobutyric acid receptor subunit alpha-6, partial [Biomphalaria pfeifferi]